MRRPRVPLAIAFAVFAAGAVPPAGEPRAQAMAGCSQEDLPALIIVVVPRGSAGIELRFEIAGIPGTMSARRYRLSPLRRRDGGRPVSLARGELRRDGRDGGWLSGEIVLHRLAPGREVAGSYRVSGTDGIIVAGRFNAAWQAGAAGCG